MGLSNIQYDLIREALTRLAKDRYVLPEHIDDIQERIRLIHETYHLIEEEQKKLTEEDEHA